MRSTSLSLMLRASADGTPELLVRRASDGYLVHVPGLLHARVSADGAVLELRPSGNPTLALERFEHQVEPLLGQLRGRLVLHGAGVVVAGGCVGFLGASGQGKSTLAALLAKRGHPVLGDDALSLELDPMTPAQAPSPAPIVAHPAAHRAVRLRPATAEALSIAPTTTDRERLAVGPAKPAPLIALFLLDEADQLSFTPVSRRDALLALATHTLRIDPTDHQLLARELAQLDRVVREVPVRRLSYPRRFDAAEELVAAIEADAASIAETRDQLR